MLNYDALYRMAKTLLLNMRPVTRDKIVEAVDTVRKLDPSNGDREKMIRQIEADFSVTLADGLMLAEDTGHVPWLPTKREA